MKKYKLLIFTYFILYFGFAFYQYYQTSLDGDLVEVALPTELYTEVLKDPFGISILLGKEPYRGPNRFFAHFQQYEYFNKMPIMLQSFFEPIQSLFVAAGLFKLIIHILLIYFLAIIGIGDRSLKNKNVWLFALIAAPLFQAEGADSIRMAVVNRFITYTVFYSLAILWILVFLTPIFFEYYTKKEPRIKKYYIWVSLILCPIITLNGALNAPILIIFSMVYFLEKFYSKYGFSFKTPTLQWLKSVIFDKFSISIFIALFFSLYSFYIGTFNIETTNGVKHSLLDLYFRLCKGIVLYYFMSFGPMMIIITIVINLFLIQKKAIKSNVFNLAIWLIVFIFIYTFLLPLGGFRDYRPYIIRDDTYIPVTLILIFYFAKTSFILLQNQAPKIWIGFLCLVLATFTFRNFSVSKEGAKEREAMQQIANSKDEVIQLKNPATVVSWDAVMDPKENEKVVQYLKKINVVKKDNSFYSVSNPYPL
jgi:hypothetical protein